MPEANRLFRVLFSPSTPAPGLLGCVALIFFLNISALVASADGKSVLYPRVYHQPGTGKQVMIQSLSNDRNCVGLGSTKGTRPIVFAKLACFGMGNVVGTTPLEWKKFQKKGEE
jgi:hypothetical protein